MMRIAKKGCRHLVSTLGPAHPTQLVGNHLTIEKLPSLERKLQAKESCWKESGQPYLLLVMKIWEDRDRRCYPGEVDGSVIAGPFRWRRGHWSLAHSWLHWRTLPVWTLQQNIELDFANFFFRVGSSILMDLRSNSKVFPSLTFSTWLTIVLLYICSI